MIIWGEENKYAYWAIMVNSLVYFLLAYFFIINFISLSSLFFAKVSGFDATLYYWGFKIHTGSENWGKSTILGVFFLGPGTALLTGLIFQNLYKRTRKYVTHFKLFYLWGFIISFGYFFGNIIVGAFFNFGTGAAFRALSVPFAIRVPLAVISVVALALIGKYSVRHILISFNSYFIKINPDQVKSLLHAQLFDPFLFGSIIIFLLKIPYHAEFNFLDTLTLFWLAIIIIPVYATNKQTSKANFKRKNKRFELQKKPLVLLIILILVFRIGLSYGLQV